MNFTVRLYWLHDLDLIALRNRPDFPFAKLMKQAVIACARGDTEFKISVPQSVSEPIEIREGCTIHFYLNNKKDADVIQMIQGIRSGFRNSAMRNIFRFYMDHANLDPYYNTTDFIVKKNKEPVPSVVPAPVLRKPDPNAAPAQVTVPDMIQTVNETAKGEPVIEPVPAVVVPPAPAAVAPPPETASAPREETPVSPVVSAPSAQTEPFMPAAEPEAPHSTEPATPETVPAEHASRAIPNEPADDNDGFDLFAAIDELRKGG